MTLEYILSKGIPPIDKRWDEANPNAPYWQKTEYQHRMAKSEIENMQLHSRYYDEDATEDNKPIIVMNWNYFKRKLQDVLERAGYRCEWQENIDNCSNCYCAVPSRPGYYGDTHTSYYTEDGEVLCPKCYEKEFESWVLPELIGNIRKAAKNVNLSQYNFTRVSDGENGFHLGQNDTPQKLLDAWKDSIDNPDKYEWVFGIDEVGQFDVHFSLWIREIEEE